MSSLPRLGFNCLTHVLVSASLCWMDGCQRDCHTFTLLCFSLFGFILLVASLLLLNSDSRFLCLESSHRPCVSPSVILLYLFLRVSPSSLPVLCFPLITFFPSACAVDCLPEQHVQVVRGKKKSRVRIERKHTGKNSFPPKFACREKKPTSITFVIERCSHNSQDVASVEMNAAARLDVYFCVDLCLFFPRAQPHHQ